jgi:hypothetical protein
MNASAYYAAEKERYAEQMKEDLAPTREEIEIAVRKLCRHFKLGAPSLRFTSGNRRSRAGASRIIINMDRASWHTIAHEVAHTMDFVDRRKRIAAMQPLQAAHAARWRKIVHRRYHGKWHTKFMDRIYDYIVANDWNKGALKLKVEQVESVREERVAAKGTALNSRARKIELRRAQILRLGRKIKALDTRLRRARRSLGALERAEARATEVTGG